PPPPLNPQPGPNPLFFREPRHVASCWMRWCNIRSYPDPETDSQLSPPLPSARQIPSLRFRRFRCGARG
ncbi:hypothetical protein COCVIDRAFT_83947, partial [Bipolaris victoriae FI3]